MPLPVLPVSTPVPPMMIAGPVTPHVPIPPSVRVIEEPEHTLVGPPIIPGRALIVIGLVA